MALKKTYMLMILDGWGIGEAERFNAIHVANTPFLDMIEKKFPNSELECSGSSVGLPSGIMGNSEVGHLNIGAGRIVDQDLLRIDKSIKNGSFSKNILLDKSLKKVLDSRSSLHLIGLLSDGGVHSQISHLYSLLELAKLKGVTSVFVHVILDGRDTPPDQGINYVKMLQAFMNKIGCGSIATICGRYYAMDRDDRWNRVEKAYLLYTDGAGRKEIDPIVAVENSYKCGETDEFVKPISITNISGEPSGLICDSDVIISFNFRSDRMREITRAFIQQGFVSFNRNIFLKLGDYVTMTLYDKDFNLPQIFPPVEMDNLIGGVISKIGLRQLRIAETEKYAHVTYFFNGGNEKTYLNEDRCLIPSPRNVSTYDKKPEMSALLLANEVVRRISFDKYDFIVINFANMDMVGHTGVMSAAVTACEIVDMCASKVTNELLRNGGTAIITADHGNAECMVNGDGKPITSHTTNKVRFVLLDKEGLSGRHLNDGRLCDIAPTIFDLMNIEKPKDMTGDSLLIK